MRDFAPVLLISFLILLLLAGSSTAQTGDWAAIEGLQSGADIYVKTIKGRKLQGQVESTDPERLVIWSQERGFPGRAIVMRQISRADVKQVRLNRRGASAVAGAAIGAGIGVGLGVAADAPSKDHEARSVVSLVFGALGAGLGAAIAKSHPFLHGPVSYEAP